MAAATTRKQRGRKRGRYRTKKQRIHDMEVARANWSRYEYGKDAGHDDLIKIMQRNEDFYLGGGKQWSEADKQARIKDKRPVIELNHIMPAINTAAGIQLHSRVDISFLPRGEGADEETAKVLAKLAKQIMDDGEYHWHESIMFEDGLIQRNGYLDVRMSFEHNVMGEIVFDLLDPMDVIPDPDAQSYDPRKWKDVIVMRWYDYNDLSGLFGEDAAKEVARLADSYINDEYYIDKPKMGKDADGSGGDEEALFRNWVKEGKSPDLRKYFVIDRQFWRYELNDVVIMPTGDIHIIDHLTPEQIEFCEKAGGLFTKHRVKRVYWTVTCGPYVLFDDWSPYKSFTVIPYFPIFRRGRRRGMVDNLRSPQDLENKTISDFLEILGSVAHSGWLVQEGSLTNMDTDDLGKCGSENGIVIEYAINAQKPERLTPPNPPSGASLLHDKAEYAIKTISGMSDAIQGQPSPEVSGVAIQAKQFQGELQVSRMIDNLALTRRMVARKILELIQSFYIAERVIRITDKTTGKLKEEITINQELEDGSVLNDVTIGKYDVVVTDTPTHATFQLNQFEQMKELVKEGVPIPPKFLIEASTIRNKHEIMEYLDQMEKAQAANPEEEAKAEKMKAEAELKRAQAEKVKAEMVNKGVEAQYSAIQTADVIAKVPETAPLADKLLRSAGYVDKDEPPIMPGAPVEGGPAATLAGGTEALPQGNMAEEVPGNPNTNPRTPANPGIPGPGPGIEGAEEPEPESPEIGAKKGIITPETEDNL